MILLTRSHVTLLKPHADGLDLTKQYTHLSANTFANDT